MSSLDLPIEKQHEIADKFGMTHAAWVDMIKDSQKQTSAFLDELHNHKSGNKLTAQQKESWQRKVDSGNPN